MRNAIIVHGKPSRDEFYDPAVPPPSSHHWLPWLAKQLLVRDIHAVRPEMPRPYAPDYPGWRREFERYDVDARTLLVGHSCGAGFLVRWLSEHPRVRVGRVALVAPWLDPDGVSAPDFFAFDLDPALTARTQKIAVFTSDDDGDAILRSVDILRDALPRARFHELPGYGHFLQPDAPDVLAALVD